MNAAPLIIVGASYAGLQMAASARERGFEEPIYLIGDEAHPPYQRPPLSKGLLTGKVQADQLPLRSAAFFSQSRIELLTRSRVTSIDPGAQCITLASGKPMRYGWLALATGASCRPLALPGAHLDGIYSLRTLDDALAIARAAQQAEHVCIIGGGYIGLEAAAALGSCGKKVTVLERGTQVLKRSMPEVMSAYIQRAHRERGTDLRTGQQISAIRGVQNRVTGIALQDGSFLPCDMVVLGIGVQPNMELAAAAGLAVGNGIDTDTHGRTSAPHILAAGDVAAVALPASVARSGSPGPAARLRLESIQAANDGAKAAAATLTGHLEPCTTVPWFWSDQFDLKFQMAGIALAGDQVVVRGDMESNRFSVAYLRHGALAAMHSVNRPVDHMVARRLVASNAPLEAAEVADPSFDLKRIADLYHADLYQHHPKQP